MLKKQTKKLWLLLFIIIKYRKWRKMSNNNNKTSVEGPFVFFCIYISQHELIKIMITNSSRKGHVERPEQCLGCVSPDPLAVTSCSHLFQGQLSASQHTYTHTYIRTYISTLSGSLKSWRPKLNGESANYILPLHTITVPINKERS